MSLPDLLSYKFSRAKPQDQEIFEHLYFDLSLKIYGMGEHFSWRPGYSWKNYYSRKLALLLQKFKPAQASPQGGVVFSNAYHNFNTELEKLGHTLFHPPWHDPLIARYAPGSLTIAARCHELRKEIAQKSVTELLAEDFFAKVRAFRPELKEYYAQMKTAAVIFPTDVCFFESMTISILKELKIPSMVFTHGLPAGYTEAENKSTDYLIVWGEEIKKNYVAQGVSADKVFVAGHPAYPQLPRHSLKSDLSRVLVLGQSVNSAFVKKVRLPDTSNLILYTEMVKEVLKSKGVKSAVLRPHPSMNKAFYRQLIDSNFYQLDENPSLGQSLAQSSLVIGPVSTSLIDAYMSGVNYFVFMPEVEGMDLVNYPLSPTFDRAHAADFLTAHNSTELAALIEKNPQQSFEKMQTLIRPQLDLSFMNKLLRRN